MRARITIPSATTTRARGGLGMRRSSRGIFVALLAAGLLPSGEGPATACSCGWNGPFLVMAPQSKIVVLAKVIGHHGEGRVGPLSMDLEVIELLCGEKPSSPLRVWGGDGLLCRPEVSQFPVGTEWVFALDGPGSKQAMTPDHTISICGAFWLRVLDGNVQGAIDDPRDMNAFQTLPLAAFRKKLEAALAAGIPPRRARATFGGDVNGGESFERPFGPGLIFRLDPSPLGWTVIVREQGRDEDISRLTPPFHFVPNPREIEGWHFRNSDNTGPNEAGDKNVNAPGEVRDFIFSPEVGRTIQGPGTVAGPSEKDVEAVGAFGQGRLRIVEQRLGNLEPGKQARFAWMRFEVELSWPDPASASETACKIPSPE